MYKCDYHTHSTFSSDGGLTAHQYSEIVQQGILDFVAITDHNEVQFALDVHRTLGQQIIVGEEVSSLEGHIIGLFLSEKIERDLSAIETVRQIKEQGGLVYIPHPFESHRSGISLSSLKSIESFVDIIEVFNARSLTRLPVETIQHTIHSKPVYASGSDAHGIRGLGTTYNLSTTAPLHPQKLINGLSHDQRVTRSASLISRFDPSFNRVKKFLGLP
jgi:predicted metal-dependent phosphoesterase TrpH